MRVVSRHDVRRYGGPRRIDRRVHRLSLLAVLLALLVPTATAITTTPATITVDVGASALTPPVHGDDGTSADPAGGVHRDDESDTGVRVVRKVRGVFLPHGLVPPTLEPAEVTRPQRTPPAYTPTWHASVSTDVHPRRGPPGTTVSSSP
jgi:hypothetical protein